ncbi:MAG: class I SAM-dependent methyltransferase [Rhodospirillales bacterium]|nr:class I SAM-dependent methyltransferase [Rhodospirillales bacterium]
MLLALFLKRVVRLGRLTVIDAYGRSHHFGPGGAPSVTIRLHEPSLHWKLFVRPELYAGEAYTDGTLTVEDASLFDFLDLMGRNFAAADGDPLGRTAHKFDLLFRRLQQVNPVQRARQNVAHHYNLSSDLYDLFLDEDRQYSCAYFTGPQDDLDAAQRAKRRHIAAKLRIEPGMRVLDIGCGWGGLSLWLAERLGVEVTGLTLSEEQLKIAQQRAVDRRLDGRARFALRDYREETGTYDRIVSVGMFEHVGLGHFDEYFACIRDRLNDGGVALLHTIGRTDGPGVTTPWIRKYIFPGGYVPALSEVVPAVERARLLITDVEVLRLHYAQTLRHWRERFLANRARAAALYDERFCRMWEFYLAGSEIAFRWLDQAVFQVQLAKNLQALPLTRDYMLDTERALAAEENLDRQPQEHAAAERAA